MKNSKLAALRDKQRRYKGELANPVYLDLDQPTLLDLGTDGFERKKKRNDALIDKAFSFIYSKIPLLMEFYNISLTDENRFLKLSISLASDFVPGFRVEFEKPPKAGRKKKWGALEYSRLLASVEELKAQRQCGDREACKIHLQRERGRAPSLSEIRTTESRLVEARDPERNPFSEFLHPSADVDGSRRREFLDVFTQIADRNFRGTNLP